MQNTAGTMPSALQGELFVILEHLRYAQRADRMSYSVRTMFGIRIVHAFKLDRKKSGKLGFQTDCGPQSASSFPKKWLIIRVIQAFSGLALSSPIRNDCENLKLFNIKRFMNRSTKPLQGNSNLANLNRVKIKKYKKSTEMQSTGLQAGAEKVGVVPRRVLSRPYPLLYLSLVWLVELYLYTKMFVKKLAVLEKGSFVRLFYTTLRESRSKPATLFPLLVYNSLQNSQGVTKRCRLSLLTNSAFVIRVQMRGEGARGGVPSCGVSANEYSCAHHVTWSPNKLQRFLPPYLTYDNSKLQNCGGSSLYI